MKKLFAAGLALCIASAGWAQEGWVRGTVVKADKARSRVTIDHEPIRQKDIRMDAMVMPFKVRDARLLDAVKPGDKVQFTLLVASDELLITQLKAAP